MHYNSHLSYRFLSLKLPLPPCAVLAGTYIYINIYIYIYMIGNHWNELIFVLQEWYFFELHVCCKEAGRVEHARFETFSVLFHSFPSAGGTHWSIGRLGPDRYWHVSKNIIYFWGKVWRCLRCFQAKTNEQNPHVLWQKSGSSMRHAHVKQEFDVVWTCLLDDKWRVSCI